MPDNQYLVQRLTAPTEEETLPSKLAPIFQGLGFAYYPNVAGGRDEMEESYSFRKEGISGSVVQGLGDEREIHMILFSSRHGHKGEQDAITKLLLQLPMFKPEE